MPVIDPIILNLAVALGIGLLIGSERERRKGSGPSRSPAGMSTFAVTSLAGAIGFSAGSQMLLSIATSGVIVLVAVAYWRGHEGRLQQRYGLAKDQARSDIDSWFSTLK
jgi:uncharacterized membrane protein YhiD involved in acid resistance